MLAGSFSQDLPYPPWMLCPLLLCAQTKLSPLVQGIPLRFVAGKRNGAVRGKGHPLRPEGKQAVLFRLCGTPE